jgi:DNA-binding transcriptional ArsR family regulator
MAIYVLQRGSMEPQEIQQARDLRIYLRTVGDLVRLQILKQLARKGEMNVNELADALRVSQPLISWHLSVLKRISLVTMRKDGRLVRCSINRPVLDDYRRQFDCWISEEDESKEKGEDDDRGLE